MIVYDKQTTLLLPAIHGIHGIVKTGKSQAVRNLTTTMQLNKEAAAMELQLTQAVDEIRQFPRGLEVGVPELYDFEVNGRELTCVHGIVAKKLKFAVQHEYKFVVVFRDEVMATLRNEFGMTERKWKQLLEAKLSA